MECPNLTSTLLRVVFMPCCIFRFSYILAPNLNAHVKEGEVAEIREKQFIRKKLPDSVFLCVSCLIYAV